MKLLYLIFIILESIIAFYLLLPLFMLSIHYLRKLLFRYVSPVEKKALIQKDFHFAAVVTGYQDSSLIPPLVDSLLKQSFPNVRIYVVIDDCDDDTLFFDHPKLRLIKPEQPLHSKIKSISLAMEYFDISDEVIVIFDSDNLVHPRYFEFLNKYFQQGYLAVQTHMLSKNTDTKYAKLDSIGHIYYTFLERQMRMELGLSACILGLGIAIEIDLYRKIQYRNRLGGFDKKLQADIVKSIPQLAFSKEAIVYDEKVDNGAVLEKQRTRWLFTYFHYFRIHLNIIKTAIKRFDFRLGYFGFIMLRPPLFILISLGLVFTLLNYFISPHFVLVWIALLIQFVCSFVFIIATQSMQKGMIQTLVYVPVMIIRQVKAIFKIKMAGKSFLKTEHSKVVYIDELLKDEHI
jgi:cellulose synthase/poly-beta-1,6-N-acetylglucosamine synthase-like glycosyltransferase